MRPHIQAALAAMAQTDIRQALGLRPLINVSGTMTVLGASIMVPQAVAAMAAIATEFVDMAELHRKASDVVAQATGAQAGFITASCASAITLSVAATMTGTRRLAIERLPDTTGLRDEVLVQTGHLVGYGASLQQSIAMTGAKVVTVGTVSMAQPYQLEEAITEQTACAVFVVSHMTVQYAMLALEQVCAVCHAKGIAVIVDAASEYDLRGFLARGADLVVYSGHKFLGGPTSGIVAGRADLVHAAREQNRGIGRGMRRIFRDSGNWASLPPCRPGRPVTLWQYGHAKTRCSRSGRPRCKTRMASHASASRTPPATRCSVCAYGRSQPAGGPPARWPTHWRRPTRR